MQNNFDANAVYHKLVTAGEEWAEAESLASQLEELRKPLLCTLKLDSGKTSDAAQETFAMAQPEYRSHLEGMIMARKRANQAKVRYLAAQAWVDARRTQESTRRAELKALG